MYALAVHFALRPGAGPAFDALVARTVDSIRTAEPATLSYAVHEVEGDPDARLFYELYADRAGFEEHERQPHVQAFLAEREQYLAAPPAVTFARLSAGLSKLDWTS